MTRPSVARLLAIAAALTLNVVVAGAAHADGSAPYTDPNASGFIGLCDRGGQTIDHGAISATPFVWSAISSSAAPSPYDGDGRTATLFAYQPREGVDPGEWSGELLTASARYTNPAHPMAQATDQDDALQAFLDAYPPQWNGLIQLRLYLGAPGQPASTRSYAATDIAIAGDSWTVVRGGAVPCDSGTATSLEDLVPKPASAASTPDAAAATTVPAQSAPAESSPSTTVDASSTAGHTAAKVTVLPNDPGGSNRVAAGALAASAAAIAGWLWLRRRRLNAAQIVPATKDR